MEFCRPLARFSLFIFYFSLFSFVRFPRNIFVSHTTQIFYLYILIYLLFFTKLTENISIIDFFSLMKVMWEFDDDQKWRDEFEVLQRYEQEEKDMKRGASMFLSTEQCGIV